MIKVAFILLFLLTGAANAGQVGVPQQFKAKVIGVKDGDTIEVLFNNKPIAVRLAHIDCPEVKGDQPFGKAAKQFTSSRCFGQLVSIINEGKFDRYKRLIAVVVNDKGENVNKELVSAGMAWHFKRYSSDQSYAVLEQEARVRHIGIWQDKDPIAPWDWRHR